MSKSRSDISFKLPSLVVACAMAVFFTAPAAAQTASNLVCNGCVNGKDIKNNSVRSNDIRNGAIKSADMKPNISLGAGSDDGDLGVKNTGGTESISLDGATGNVTNLFDNAAGSSNGLVKAWARMAANGTLIACYRCNPDPAVTGRFFAGVYNVDFTPLSTDISGRPYSATVNDAGLVVPEQIGVENNGADVSRVIVTTADNDGTRTDAPFIVLVY